MSLMLAAYFFGVSAVAVPVTLRLRKRYKSLREEVAIKEPLTAYLDTLIARASGQEPFLHRLSLHEGCDEAGRVISRGYWISTGPSKDGLHRISCSKYRRDHRRPWRYAIDFIYPTLEHNRFPGWGRECDSPWFVDRMKELFSRCDSYPYDELVEVKEDRKREEEMAELDRELEDIEELLLKEAGIPHKPT